MEAARAGDLGRGFAVVASEVKNLAEETGRAAGGIARQIAEIHDGIQQADSAVTGIVERIEQVNALQAAIAAAVEEQSATVRGVEQSIEGVAKLSSSIGAGLDSVGRASRETVDAATSTREASARVELLASEIQSVV